MRRPSTVYAPFDEPILMNRLFPNPKKVKPIKREEIVGERIRGNDNFNSDGDYIYDFIFRNEFENCDHKIKGDVFKYNKRKERMWHELIVNIGIII